MKKQYINIRGKVISLDSPWIMGIVNVTDDSFYSESRTLSSAEVRQRVARFVDEGANCIDVGGYSSRPGASVITPEEEYRRLSIGLEAIDAVAPDIPVSIDTFRADVAARCCRSAKVDIINDISGGTLDPEMWPLVADLKVAYVLMHTRGTPENMATLTDYDDVTADVIADLSRKVRQLHLLGVNDVIVDPGFGFAKTLHQNYQLMAELEAFHTLGCPLLVGISRKSMIYKLLNTSPEDSLTLTGTTALNTVALMKGASIIRVHDVREATETKNIIMSLREAVS